MAGFLDALVEGPSTLVFEGAAGIGKTTLWAATLDEAHRRGLRVRSCRAAATEVQLGLAGLADLLHEAEDGVLASLPAVQRRALAAAVLADDDSGVSPTRARWRPGSCRSNDGAGPHGPLARAGADIGATVAIALGLIVFGLYLLARRRRTRTA